MVHYHPLRFAYALTGISAFLYYYFPIENLFDAFSEIWKKQNEGKPMLLRFYHRKSGEKPYIYIKITVPQNMGNVKQLGG